MARLGEIKITVNNRQDSAQEKDYLFFTRVGEFAMYSKILTRSLHADQFRISGGISQTINDTKKAEVILNAPVIVSHNKGMKYLLKIQEALTQPRYMAKIIKIVKWLRLDKINTHFQRQPTNR